MSYVRSSSCRSLFNVVERACALSSSSRSWRIASVCAVRRRCSSCEAAWVTRSLA